MRTVLLLSMFIALMSASGAFAQAPPVMPFQINLTDSTGAAVADSVTLTVEIYDDLVAGSLLWGPEDHRVLPVNGVASLLLGAGAPAMPLDPGVFQGSLRWLAVQVDGTALEPRLVMGSSAYAFSADHSPGGASGVAFSADNSEDNMAAGTATYNTVTIDAPGPGMAIVQASGYFSFQHTSGTRDAWRGSISTTTTVQFDESFAIASWAASIGTSTEYQNFTCTKVYTIPAAGSYTYNFVADNYSGSVRMGRNLLKAEFVGANFTGFTSTAVQNTPAPFNPDSNPAR